MWKIERFQGSEDKDPLEEMVDFVNARHLQAGQFQFTLASDEEGYDFCVLLYTEQKPAAQRQEPARGLPEGPRPSRFAAPAPRAEKPYHKRESAPGGRAGREYPGGRDAGPSRGGRPRRPGGGKFGGGGGGRGAGRGGPKRGR